MQLISVVNYNFKMVTTQGNHGSRNSLGILYETGNGVIKNLTVALDWYKQASEGGDVNAGDNYNRLKSIIQLQH